MRKSKESSEESSVTEEPANFASISLNLEFISENFLEWFIWTMIGTRHDKQYKNR